MLPRLGQKYEIETEVISKSWVDYHTDEYGALGLPPAPAAIVGEEVVLQGPDISDISEEKVEAAIGRHLGLPELPPETRKGILGRIFHK
jgi:hypothetical protein